MSLKGILIAFSFPKRFCLMQLAKIRPESHTAAGGWVQEQLVCFCIWQVDLLLILSRLSSGSTQHHEALECMSALQLWGQAWLSIHYTCVVSDLSDSQPAVVWELPEIKTIGVSSLEHTNFFPPSHVAVMGVQNHVGSDSVLVHHQLSPRYHLGDALGCGDLFSVTLGCISGSGSSSS